MARPIKETPELFGKDAERFGKLISQPKPVSKKDKERVRKAYEVMKSISISNGDMDFSRLAQIQLSSDNCIRRNTSRDTVPIIQKRNWNATRRRNIASP